jgi:hypothetical protein
MAGRDFDFHAELSAAITVYSYADITPAIFSRFSCAATAISADIVTFAGIFLRRAGHSWRTASRADTQTIAGYSAFIARRFAGMISRTDASGWLTAGRSRRRHDG